MKIKVCDAMMGEGKTSASINMMKRDLSSNYIFITPYKDETERIKRECENRHFALPRNLGKGKLTNLHALVEQNRNIASTHALFKQYNTNTIELIKSKNYKLVLDEVFTVIEQVKCSKNDLDIIFNKENGLADVDDDGYVIWLDDDYEGKFDNIKLMSQARTLVKHDDNLLLWLFPKDVFMAFKDVIVLTYMFDAQFQKYYYDMHNIEIEYIGTTYTEKTGYEFCRVDEMTNKHSELKTKIHILDNANLNHIGRGVGKYQFKLSSTWFANNTKKGSVELKNNLYNVFRNVYNAKSAEIMWTCFKRDKSRLKGGGYTNGFVSVNTRATNKFRDKKYLAFCVNLFYDPYFKNFFTDHGVEIQEDRWALSEMIQWIWRSTIRDGNEIWIYIPSERMRTLLINWLDSLL